MTDTFETSGFQFSINPDGKSVALKTLLDKSESIVSIPRSAQGYIVTKIGDCAFSSCKALTNIIIPNSVTKIGENVFRGCKALTSITVDADNPIYDSRENCNAVIHTATNTLICGCKSTTIPKSVISINRYAFYECWAMTSINIPNSVTEIGDRAFDSCEALTNITIPNSVTKIGDSAFSSCEALTNIIIPNSVTKIGDRTFLFCEALTNIIIPNSVTEIGDRAFESCEALTNITIPNSVTKIGDYAFRFCKALTNIIIPNSVTKIGENVFSGCKALTSITVDADNPIYDSRENCNAVIHTATNTLICGCKSTTIPKSVISINRDAFYGCRAMTSINIPNSVTEIGDRAFDNCEALTNITIPNSVTKIGDSAFLFCEALTKVTLTGTGNFTASLSEYIGKKIETLNIGSGISSINDLCCNPKEIWCYAEMPPKCSAGTFTGFGATLHVPSQSIEAYFTAEVWKDFPNIVFDADEKVTLSHSNLLLASGKEQLFAKVEKTPQTAVKWSSDNPSVATVNEQGEVRAVYGGTCRIYATIASNPAVYASCCVTVDGPVSIALDSDCVEIKTKVVSTITPKFYPKEIDITVTSRKPDVVIAKRIVVNESFPNPEVGAPRAGKQRVQLVGLKTGTSMVTISTTDGFSVTLHVTVTDTGIVTGSGITSAPHD